MDFRKIISLWALLALLLGQVALAGHNATHIEHGFSQEIIVSYDAVHDHGQNHDHGHENEEAKEHQCSECLLTKALQTAFYNAPATLSFFPEIEVLVAGQKSVDISINRYYANAPRAPPYILI